ncbi:MAG: hypothetical protein WB441_04540 [Nocardioidaceae bacterium]
MSSWRDETDEQVRDELDGLLDVSLRAARGLLDEAGEFYPFVVVLAESTEVLSPMPKTGPREMADVETVLDLCWQVLADRTADARAGAVVSNVGSAGSDAVAVALEHRDGPAIEVFLPYREQGKTNGKKPAQRHRYGDLQATPGRRRVWG